jgi:hypothetical protein
VSGGTQLRSANHWHLLGGVAFVTPGYYTADFQSRDRCYHIIEGE